MHNSLFNFELSNYIYITNFLNAKLSWNDITNSLIITLKQVKIFLAT